jgi:hypothetical protein
MNLLLPSGAVACVEEPRLRAVLLSGGSPAALIDAVWTHDMDPECLRPEDRTYLLDWCLERLARDQEAAAFTEVCERFRTPPSQRLRITDPGLAFECDYQFAKALTEARAESGSDDVDQEERAEGGVRFTTPDGAFE